MLTDVSPNPTQKEEWDHPELVTPVSLPEAGSRTHTAELKTTSLSVQWLSFVTHLRQRQIFKMQEALHHPVAQAIGSKQKTMFHGTLKSHMILIKEKWLKKKKTEGDVHGQMFKKFRINQG